jgi:uncharacterized lipoprotein YmbA
MRRALVLLLSAGLIAGLAGCSLQRAAPEWSGYLLAAPRPQAAAPGSAGALHIAVVQVAPAFAGGQLTVRTSEFGYETDFYHRFLAAPDDMLRAELVDWLQAAGWASTALPSAATTAEPHTLALYVSEFYADVRDPKHPEAVLAFDARVTDAAGEAIFRRRYAERVPATARTADTLIAGLNAALVQALGKLEADLKAAGAGRPK